MEPLLSNTPQTNDEARAVARARYEYGY